MPYTIDIWKWDGYKYRLANLKFKKHIMNSYFGRYIDSLGRPFLENNQLVLERVINWAKTKCFLGALDDDELGNVNPIPRSAVFPPPKFTKIMIYLYSSGLVVQADSVLNAYWPPDKPGKDEYKELFKWYMDDNSLQRLRDSDW